MIRSHSSPKIHDTGTNEILATLIKWIEVGNPVEIALVLIYSRLVKFHVNAFVNPRQSINALLLLSLFDRLSSLFLKRSFIPVWVESFADLFWKSGV